MDIKIPDSLLRQYLKTDASAEEIAAHLSLCGPTVDLLEKNGSDWIYHLEIITNRIDAASTFGVAREAVAILNQAGIKASLIHDPYQLPSINLTSTKKPVKVTIDDPDLVPHFACIALNQITFSESPQNTQAWLSASGQRPINNLVDITNELTLRYGQPVHIFDLDLIKKQTMIVRLSRPGETILTLDNQTHTLPGGDIVIEDGDGRLIDLCGIMGGGLSAVSDKTANVLLFVQTYDPLRIRKTSLALQKRTLAAQIFEKNPDPELVVPVLHQGIRLLQERANAHISSAVIDIYPNPRKTKTINLDLPWLKQFVGYDISTKEVVSILNHLGFGTPLNGHSSILPVTVPSWRFSDINLREDLTEEITRVYGYYRLPSVIPQTDLPSVPADPLLAHEQSMRQYLAHLGFTEIYNNPLVSDVAHFKLQNPLSSESVYMRQSLIPSLLSNLDYNRGLIKPPIRIFELANIYLPGKQDLAHEQSTLSLVIQGDSFLKAKGYLEAIAAFWHLSFTYRKNTDGAQILCQSQEIGLIDLVDIKNQIIAAELNFELISSFINPHHLFSPVPQHPSIIEDLTFTLPPRTEIGPILTFIPQIDPQIYPPVNLVTTYDQNYTLRISYNHPKKTLTDQSIKAIRQKIVDSLKTHFQAQLVGKLI